MEKLQTIIKKNKAQENHFHNVLCLSETKGMDIKMKKKCRVCGMEIEGCIFCCENCYEKIKDNSKIFAKIKEEWKLEAKQEDEKYFYFVEETREILEGKKNMVIGRKGEGKTAIAQFICNQIESDVFTEKMTF